MNADDRQRIREIVVETIQEIKADIEILEEAAKPVAPDNAYGRVSRMDAIHNQAVIERTLRDKKISLERYENILPGIESDTYGKCKACGQEIPVERLCLLPYVNLCRECTDR